VYKQLRLKYSHRAKAVVPSL